MHIDSNLPGVGYVLGLQATWLLDDFTSENGATRVVPKSHTRKLFAGDNVIYDDEVVIAGVKKGSIIVFDSSLWHGSSEKITDGERWIIVTNYSRWFMKPSFDQTRNTPVQIYNKLSDDQKKLLGFKFRPPVDEFSRITRISDEFEFE